MPTPQTGTQVKQDAQLDALLRGMQTRRLYEVSTKLLQSENGEISNAAMVVARQARAACEQISMETMTFQQRLVTRLKAAGLDAQPPFALTEASGLQYHEFSLEIRPDQLGQVLEIASEEGFAVDEVLRRKWQAVSRASSQVYLMAWDSVSTRMLLRWKPAKRNLVQKLEPVPADFAFAPIPQPLWPAYYLVKPVRLGVEKLTGRRTADRLGLKSGSFSLGTPHVLLEPLFDHVGLSKDDTIVDLGCGDGRILVAAAKYTGCKAKGVEQNAALVDEARRAAKAAGVSELVDVSQGSALDYPLDDASVVFMFLPKALLPVILASAQASARSGTRMLAHEQHRLDMDWSPSTRTPIIAENAMTVAHIWTVGAS